MSDSWRAVSSPSDAGMLVRLLVLMALSFLVGLLSGAGVAVFAVAAF